MLILPALPAMTQQPPLTPFIWSVILPRPLQSRQSTSRLLLTPIFPSKTTRLSQTPPTTRSFFRSMRPRVVFLPSGTAEPITSSESPTAARPATLTESPQWKLSGQATPLPLPTPEQTILRHQLWQTQLTPKPPFLFRQPP